MKTGKKKTKVEQHEELIQTLKFTPRTYTIDIGPYGGEVYFGVVDRKIYDFFKEHKINIEEYASDWDEDKWQFIPEDLRPFAPGSGYDCDDLAHNSGATFDSGNNITVYDENNDEVWSCALDYAQLEAQGVAAESVEEIYINEQQDGTVIFYGAQGEKGFLFSGRFLLSAPFDAGRLVIEYSDLDGWEIVSGVSYDGEEIINNHSDSTGKWSEAKWIIVGDEEVYDGDD